MDILIYGTINSVTLALYAIGFAMVYGVSRLPNFAHGALYVVSGFITWSFLNLMGLNYLLSIILCADCNSSHGGFDIPVCAHSCPGHGDFGNHSLLCYRAGDS